MYDAPAKEIFVSWHFAFSSVEGFSLFKMFAPQSSLGLNRFRRCSPQQGRVRYSAKCAFLRWPLSSPTLLCARLSFLAFPPTSREHCWIRPFSSVCSAWPHPICARDISPLPTSHPLPLLPLHRFIFPPPVPSSLLSPLLPFFSDR